MNVITFAGVILIAVLGFFAALALLAAVGASLGADCKEAIESRLERRDREALIAKREEAAALGLVLTGPVDPLERLYAAPAREPERTLR